MKPQFDSETELILSCLIKHADLDHPVYLVGGIVRDILLNQVVHDIDVSYCGNVRVFAKKVADSLEASFFMLNEEFQTARIIFQSNSKKKRWIDIVATRENQIEKDLYLRDFTINSIAIDLHNRNQIIDPYAGAVDLQKKLLKVTNPNSIKDDPIRILRAIRLAVQFGWKISPETIHSIKDNSKLLQTVTNERKRDEIFKILFLPNPTIALRIMKNLQILDLCFPGIAIVSSSKSFGNDEENFIDLAIRLIEKYIEFEELVIYRQKTDAAMDLMQAEILVNFGGFREFISSYFQMKIHQDRSLRSIFIFTLLYVPTLENFSYQILQKRNLSQQITLDVKELPIPIKGFVLSKNEEKWIRNFAENLMLINQTIENKDNLSPELAFKFFEQTKTSGVAICLNAFLKQLVNYQFTQASKSPKEYVCLIRYLLDAYFHHYHEWINPDVFIDGNDVRKVLKIKGGKIIGEILNKIKLKIVNGELNNRQQVIDYLKSEYS